MVAIANGRVCVCSQWLTQDVTEFTTRIHPRMLPTGNAKTALLPAILGDVNNAGGGGAPIERENEGGMDHFMAIENREFIGP